tara:strand:+ start:304 stop:486 length:183 start_codon:yes stop_codon:yes gene_type:complete
VKVGDLVIALDADRGIGVIKGIKQDHKGMNISVVFISDKDYPHGYSMAYRPINLQIVEAK